MATCSRIARMFTVGVAALAVAPTLSFGDTTTPAAPAQTTPTPAAGSCVHPWDPLGPNVNYRYASRVNGWRARTAVNGLAARSLPSATSASVGTLRATTLHTGGPAWYFVLDARQVGDVCWLQVRMPAPANNKIGWVNRDDLVVERTAWQIEVDLSERMVYIYSGSRLKLKARVVIGKSSTPTPKTGAGQPFALYDAEQGKASDFSGTWQLATTAVSPQVPSMGRVGLHGRGGASLRDPLGTAASHGCVRAANTTVNTVVKMIGLDNLLGTPFVVRA